VVALPELCIDTRDEVLRAIPFDCLSPPRQLVLAWHRDRHPDGLDDVLARCVRAASVAHLHGVMASRYACEEPSSTTLMARPAIRRFSSVPVRRIVA